MAFLEFVNAEFEGEYWLPSTQRSELVAGFALTGNNRSVFRGVSRFTDYKIHESEEPTSDSVFTLCPAHVTFAPANTLDRFGRWHADLGATTAAVASDDFDDLAPPQWKRPPARCCSSFFRERSTMSCASTVWRASTPVRRCPFASVTRRLE